MECEAVDECTIVSLAVPEGTEGVKVGTVIALLAPEGEATTTAPKVAKAESAPKEKEKPKNGQPVQQHKPAAEPAVEAASAPIKAPVSADKNRVKDRKSTRLNSSH